MKKECLEQKVLSMDENVRQDLTTSLHDYWRSDLNKVGFNVTRSEYRGKSTESIKRKLEETDNFNKRNPIWDLCGLRFFLKTDKEIDEIINWFNKKYKSSNISEPGSFWVKDLRKNQNKDTNEDLKGVQIGLSFNLTHEGEEHKELMEIQLVKEE
jgi:ppGpp synthetase/RelA/SpoT-type nucleotidyltranferase